MKEKLCIRKTRIVGQFYLFEVHVYLSDLYVCHILNTWRLNPSVFCFCSIVLIALLCWSLIYSDVGKNSMMAMLFKFAVVAISFYNSFSKMKYDFWLLQKV